MWKRYIATAALLATLAVVAPTNAEAFDITGGSVWQNRTGPGLAVGMGLNGCVDDLCQRNWGTGASIGGIVGFHYRLIPNVVLFGDMHMGHVPVDDDGPGITRDNGMIFEMTVGGEFHVPLNGWVAPYVGLGLGWAYLGNWVHTEENDYHAHFTGFDFQVRIGADFYPFSKLANLSIGPAIFLSFPAWVNACRKSDGDNRTCGEPDNMELIVPPNRRDDKPKFVFFGAMAKLWF